MNVRESWELQRAQILLEDFEASISVNFVFKGKLNVSDIGHILTGETWNFFMLSHGGECMPYLSSMIMSCRLYKKIFQLRSPWAETGC